MKKLFFDFIVSPFSVFENPFYNYIIITIIGLLAFHISWNIVGKLGIRGELGSLLHWTIRIIAFVTIWFLCCIIINFILFIISQWIYMLLIIILLLILFILKEYAKKHPTSILNKKIYK